VDVSREEVCAGRGHEIGFDPKQPPGSDAMRLSDFPFPLSSDRIITGNCSGHRFFLLLPFQINRSKNQQTVLLALFSSP
jgi:hypothetical protein